MERDNKWTLFCLIVGLIGQTFFFIIELINLKEEGFEHYIDDKSNIADYSMFFLYIVYFILKKLDFVRTKYHREKGEIPTLLCKGREDSHLSI